MPVINNPSQPPRMLVGSLYVLAITTCTDVAVAQPRFFGDATWRWEISADAGQTWSTGLIEVPPTQSSVMIRARCWFTQPPQTYFGAAHVDAFVIGAGAGDSVSGIGRGDLQPNPAQSLAATRFDDLIKIDDSRDLEPPGTGPHWAILNQYHPSAATEVSFANPIRTMQYVLHLDGIAGERRVDAVFRVFFEHEPARRVYLYDFSVGNWNSLIHETLHHEPAIVRVVPAPGAAAVVGILSFASMARRRRGSPTRPRP